MYEKPNKKATADEKKLDEEILAEFRTRLVKQIEDESESREMMRDDIRFQSLDQWDERLRSERENDPNGSRPCLTIDKINQYINQVVNDLRRNKVGVKISPANDDADVDTAKVGQGIVRNIEDQSNGSEAYDTSTEWQVKAGLGFFRVLTDYESDDSFDQEIRLGRIQDTFSCYLGPHTKMDGSDAAWGVIIEQMPIEEFKATWPKARCNDADFVDGIELWKSDSTVFVGEYYYTEYEKKTLFFLKDGTKVFSDKYDGDKANVAKERISLVKQIKWCKLTGCEILEKRDWAGKWIPIIPVIGKESFVDGKRVLWGLVRPVKDNLRMYNYWVSAITEKIGLSPKTPFIGAVGQFATHPERWKNANRVNYSHLEYDAIDVNGNAVPPPRRGEPAPIESAMISMLNLISGDVQSTLGMFNASVGQSESQQSGRAINALQEETDNGVYHFQANRDISIRHAGRIIFDLIPKIMDTKRIVRILGEDGEVSTVELDPGQKTSKRQVEDKLTGKIKKIYNLGVGKFDVSISAGPSYRTKRMEAAQVFTALSQSARDPASSAILQYLTVKNSDFTSSEEALTMLKSVLPPQAMPPPEGEEKIPPEVMQKIQELVQQGQQLQQQLQEVGQENQQLKSGAQIKAAELEVKSATAKEELKIKKEIQDAELALQREKVDAEIDLDRRVADAKYKIQKDSHDFDMDIKRKENGAPFESDAVPMLMEGMNGAFSQLGALMQQNSEMQAQTLAVQQAILETLQAPKNVSIGGIQKDAEGKIVGATVLTVVR